MRAFSRRSWKRNFATLALLLSVSAAAAADQSNSIRVSVNPAKIVGRSTLTLGVTLMNSTLDPLGDSTARALERSHLAEIAPIQNEHLMGWGTKDPEPAPNIYDWHWLDQRVALNKATGATSVITLCCAPSWMRGAPAGEADWVHLADTSPNDESFDAFVALSVAAARRYPDVKYFQVWNEMKGFWNPQEHRWSYERYTDLYNRIYRNLKAVSPDIEVGGPYVALRNNLDAATTDSSLSGPYGFIDVHGLDVLKYWLRHKDGADFVAVDGAIRTRDQRLPADLFGALQFYSDVGHWIRARTDLPIWWSEWYSAPPDAAQPVRLALMAATLIRMADTASVALHWGPEEILDWPKEDLDPLWTSTAKPGGGAPEPFYVIQKNFEKCFPRGTPLVQASASSPDLLLLASPSCLMLVNQTADAKNIAMDHDRVQLMPYEVKFISQVR